MTQGKCSRKNWVWKPVKASLLDFEPRDSIGTVYCTIETLLGSEFSKEEIRLAKSSSLYLENESTSKYIVFKSKGVSKKETQIENYNRLKQFVEENFESADRAILASKKSVTQISTLRCGAK